LVNHYFGTLVFSQIPSRCMYWIIYRHRRRVGHKSCPTEAPKTSEWEPWIREEGIQFVPPPRSNQWQVGLL